MFLDFFPRGRKIQGVVSKGRLGVASNTEFPIPGIGTRYRDSSPRSTRVTTPQSKMEAQREVNRKTHKNYSVLLILYRKIE